MFDDFGKSVRDAALDTDEEQQIRQSVTGDKGIEESLDDDDAAEEEDDELEEDEEIDEAARANQD